MKNVILIHGINGIPKIFEWLKNELDSRNIKTILMSFPPLEGVIYENWAKILDEYKDEITEDSTIVCHSIGNEFIIKYLTENNLKVGTYIGLAGFADVFYNEGKDVLKDALHNMCEYLLEKVDEVQLPRKN